jgi:hypothetical protein
LTVWLKGGLLALVSAGDDRLALDTTADARVIWFVALLALGTALVIGLVPALQASRANLQQAMRANAAGGDQRRLAPAAQSGSARHAGGLLGGAAGGGGLLAGSLGKLRQVGQRLRRGARAPGQGERADERPGG